MSILYKLRYLAHLQMQASNPGNPVMRDGLIYGVGGDGFNPNGLADRRPGITNGFLNSGGGLPTGHGQGFSAGKQGLKGIGSLPADGLFGSSLNSMSEADVVGATPMGVSATGTMPDPTVVATPVPTATATATASPGASTVPAAATTMAAPSTATPSPFSWMFTPPPSVRFGPPPIAYASGVTKPFYFSPAAPVAIATPAAAAPATPAAPLAAPTSGRLTAPALLASSSDSKRTLAAPHTPAPAPVHVAPVHVAPLAPVVPHTPVHVAPAHNPANEFKGFQKLKAAPKRSTGAGIQKTTMSWPSQAQAQAAITHVAPAPSTAPVIAASAGLPTLTSLPAAAHTATPMDTRPDITLAPESKEIKTNIDLSQGLPSVSTSTAVAIIPSEATGMDWDTGRLGTRRPKQRSADDENESKSSKRARTTKHHPSGPVIIAPPAPAIPVTTVAIRPATAEAKHAPAVPTSTRVRSAAPGQQLQIEHMPKPQPKPPTHHASGPVIVPQPDGQLVVVPRGGKTHHASGPVIIPQPGPTPAPEQLQIEYKKPANTSGVTITDAHDENDNDDGPLQLEYHPENALVKAKGELKKPFEGVDFSNALKSIVDHIYTSEMFRNLPKEDKLKQSAQLVSLMNKEALLAQGISLDMSKKNRGFAFFSPDGTENKVNIFNSQVQVTRSFMEGGNPQLLSKFKKWIDSQPKVGDSLDLGAAGTILSIKSVR